jgi:ATP-dependent DNA helicase RecG
MRTSLTRSNRGKDKNVIRIMNNIEEIRIRKEGQTFDCKSIQIEPKALAIPIVAMANADGGLLAIGISDKTRRIEGVDQHAEKLNELLRVPFDFCIPSVSVTCSYLPCVDSNGNENRVLLMEIPASPSLHTNQADEAFMRVGDKSRKLSFDERVQLMYDKGERSYEDTSVCGASIDDIDMNAVTEFTKLLDYGKSPLEYLRENNHFVTMNKKDEEEVSTACILLFGRNPQLFFPRARTRFIRYEGIDEKVGAEMNVVKDVIFEGTILNQVKKTIDYLETQIRERTFLGQHGQFVTRRDYPEFVIQEMTVNACCHRAYNIKGTEIQIKMFDDRLVFESPGKLPGMVRASNIRKTHFSRNPKIAAFLKAYHYVKEYGEGVDRMCRELEANGAAEPTFHTDDFILKVTVPKVTEKVVKVTEKVTENGKDVTVKVTVNSKRVTVNQERVIELLMERASAFGDKLTENRVAILELMIENPYISKIELAKTIGISTNSVMRNINYMRDKYLRRVGADKNGFWEIIMD